MKKQYVKKIPFLALAGFICAVSIGKLQVSLAKQATKAPKGGNATIPKNVAKNRNWAAGDRLLNMVRETTAKHALKLSSQVCKIQEARLGGRVGMIGAN